MGSRRTVAGKSWVDGEGFVVLLVENWVHALLFLSLERRGHNVSVRCRSVRSASKVLLRRGGTLQDDGLARSNQKSSIAQKIEVLAVAGHVFFCHMS